MPRPPFVISTMTPQRATVPIDGRPVPVPDALQTAARWHGNGELDRAETVYHAILALEPDQPDALHLLGVVMLQRNHPDAAIDLISRAIAHRPGIAMYHNNLGKAYRTGERFEEALAQFQRAHALDPGMVEALYNSGETLRWLNRMEEAIGMFERVVGMRPQVADAHFQLGNALMSGGRPGAAIARYQATIRLDMRHVAAHQELAIALHQSGKLQEAIAQYRATLALRPDDAHVWSNLGNAYLALGDLDKAESSLRHALQINPRLPAGHNNLGNILKSKGKVLEAVTCYRRAIELEPRFTEAHSNLLLSLNYLPDISPETVLEEHKKWEQTHGLPLGPQHINSVDPERRLRIGYVSPDFRMHAVAYFVEPLLKYQDKSRFEVICYAQVMRPDKVTERMKGYAHQWRNTCGLSDSQLADLIRSDGIDILVDLAGHTSDSRLTVFTARPAPVQVSYIGYVNTTGLSTIDYRITDELTDPPEAQKFYTEKLVYLRNGFSCYAPPPAAPDVSPLPSLRTGQVTFASFNNLFKINAAVIELWCRVLHANPASRMRIFRHLLKGSAQQELYAAFARHGIDNRRLDIWSEIPPKHLHLPPGLQHLGLYEDIDTTLDTFPWNGHTISCESLWMGVPVVTLFGDRHAGRICASILHAVGLRELVASNHQDYIDIATRLANNPDELTLMRGALRDRMRNSPLCDGAGFARSVEHAYRDMWQSWCQSRAATSTAGV